MENKYVGYILIGVSALIILNILIFQSMIGDLDEGTCTIDSCPYHASFNKLLYISYSTVGLLIIIALVLIFSKPKEKIIIRKIKEKPQKIKINTSDLKTEEKQIYNMISEQKAIFQADLIEKTGFGKAKITRIIDRLEGKGLVERKRRGMTNVVVLKEN